MYEQVLIDNVTSGLPPSDLVSRYSVRKSMDGVGTENPQLIVFVHGINNSQFDYESTSETMFKRLYWSGYQGRFASVKWPCAFLPNDGSVSPTEYLKAFNFNKGEFYAWKSAGALAAYLQSFSSAHTNYQINVIAHSQGNIVASEAIKLGAPVDNYILSQAAVPAHCYDTSTNVPFLQKFLDKESTTPTPLDASDGGYDGYFTNLTGNLVNFFNTQDYALATGTKLGIDVNWEANEEKRKPEDFGYMLGAYYYYVPTNHLSYRGYLSGQEQVADSLETKAMVARSSSKAIGALAGVTGIINTNVSVDLFGTFGFGDTRDDHSAQFKRSIQSVRPYYQTVLQKIAP